MIYWPQGQWGGVRARSCAPVHSYAVKWSRNTKWKMTVERLFTSRHQASFKMGLIASPCSWSWFKVLTLISWCPACCQDMFQKAFPKVRSPPSPCQPRNDARNEMMRNDEKWCTSQKQREVIFDLPRPLPPKVPDRTASKYSPCGCAGDSNRST